MFCKQHFYFIFSPVSHKHCSQDLRHSVVLIEEVTSKHNMLDFLINTDIVYLLCSIYSITMQIVRCNFNYAIAPF